MLSRLALALLAVMGFVAPVCAREADGVVQTAGRVKQATLQAQVAAELSLPAPAPLPARAQARGLTTRAEAGSKRYLLNRAWLI